MGWNGSIADTLKNSKHSMNIATQFGSATVDFYSALAEQNLSVAAQVGGALQAMVDDQVLDAAQCEMVHDCLQKLGRAATADLPRHCKPVAQLPELANLASVCAFAGSPHEEIAAASFARTTARLVDEIGRERVESLHSISSTKTANWLTTPASPHLQHARAIFSEAARHVNGMSTVGFRPHLVLQALGPVCSACADRVVEVTRHFQKHVRLQEWVSFTQTGGAPPRRAKKAELLVQEMIDPILNEASELCQEISRFHTFMVDIDTNLRKAAAAAAAAAATKSPPTAGSITGKPTCSTTCSITTDPSTNAASGEMSTRAPSESIRLIREVGQELVVGYMMVEAYCVTKNIETAIKIAVVEGGGGGHSGSADGSCDGTSGGVIGASSGGHSGGHSGGNSGGNTGKSPSISLVEESFFIFKLRFSRALNTLHADAPRFILNRLQASLEETVYPEIHKLLSLESTLDVSGLMLDHDTTQTGTSMEDNLTSNFNATLNNLLDNSGEVIAATATTTATTTAITSMSSTINTTTNTNTTSTTKALTTRRHPLSSLLVAACSARKAQQHVSDFVMYVRGQFAHAFGQETLSSVEPMLDELINVQRSFQKMQENSLEKLVSSMDETIKDVIRSTDLLEGEKYELATEDDFNRRQVNDLFAQKLIDSLHHTSSFLQRCKRCMMYDDYAPLVRVVASHVAKIIEKVWLQMRVNELGGLMMETDLRILIDQISHMELKSGSVRSCFARLTALVWLVNLEQPEALVDEETLHTSKRVLACLNRDEVCHCLRLRVEFHRNFELVATLVDRFFSM